MCLRPPREGGVFCSPVVRGLARTRFETSDGEKGSLLRGPVVLLPEDWRELPPDPAVPSLRAKMAFPSSVSPWSPRAQGLSSFPCREHQGVPGTQEPWQLGWAGPESGSHTSSS